MVKAIWAVACTLVALGGLIAFVSGCASAKSKMKEFGTIDVGEGPGSTLTRLIELQKQNNSPNTIPAIAPQGSTLKEETIPPQPAPDSQEPVIVYASAKPPASPPKTKSDPDVGSAGSSGANAAADTQPRDAPKEDKPPVKLNSPPPSSPSAAVSTPPPAASGGPQSATDQNYRLGPEDVVHISVWGNDEITLDVTVRPDGRVSVPLIQDVQAEGLTAAELADVIHVRLLAFIREPQVSVIVRQVNAPRFFVIGNVARPGTYPLRGNTSVLQALSLAGGFTEFASRRRIKVVRQWGGRQDVSKVNYFEIIAEGDGNYLLRPGDTIVVP